MDQELEKIRILLKDNSLSFRSIKTGVNSSLDYLIELPVFSVKSVPTSWILVSSTKQFSRYHTPTVLEIQETLLIYKDELKLAFKSAWAIFLTDVDTKIHQRMRDSINSFGKLDVLLSFATFASQPGYIQPIYDLMDEISSPEGIIIKGARHPMVEQFLEKQGKSFVPNDIELGMNFGKQRCQVVTGPNMGGKSSYVRMIALICLLGQLGCHVPALEAKLIVFDNIFTRMGAGDDLASGMSTFMVELYRTSSILERVTPRSLVILDELGRGTSTHDGMAIAKATLNYFIENIGCTILFVTHFLSVSDMISSEERFKDIASNVHMASMNEKLNFIDENSLHKKRKLDSGIEDIDEEDNDNPGKQSSLDPITFLYKVVKGAASSSYGLNVARLVGLDSEIIEIARAKACWMKSI